LIQNLEEGMISVRTEALRILSGLLWFIAFPLGLNGNLTVLKWEPKLENAARVKSFI